MHFGSYLYHIVPFHYVFTGHSTRFKVFWAGIALNSCRFSCIMPLRGMLQSGLTCAQRARAHSVNEIHFLQHQNSQFWDICDGHWIHLMDFGGCIELNSWHLSRTIVKLLCLRMVLIHAPCTCAPFVNAFWLLFISYCAISLRLHWALDAIQGVLSWYRAK